VKSFFLLLFFIYVLCRTVKLVYTTKSHKIRILSAGILGENIIAVIAVKFDVFFRIFIFLRDTRRLAGRGKFGALASFGCAGSIVLSYQHKKGQKGKTGERKTFNYANLNTLKKLLDDVAMTLADGAKLFSSR
jgi:hypothetical protein